MRAMAGRHLPKLAGEVRSGASYARHQRKQAIGLRGNAFAGQLVDGGRRRRGDGRGVGLEPQPAPRRRDDDGVLELSRDLLAQLDDDDSAVRLPIPGTA